MFELTEPTAATLKSVTPRLENHGDDEVVALSMKLEIQGANTLLDLLSPTLRPTLYTSVEGQEDLPGVEPSMPLLRCVDFERHTLSAKFDGWTLTVEHGIDEEAPITIGGCKLDAFTLEAMQGGSVKLAFRVGSSDVDAEEIGLICGKLGSEVTITLKAPEKPVEAIDGSTEAFERDHPQPTAGDIFAERHGDVDRPMSHEEFARAAAEEIARIEQNRESINSKRTARGRAATKAALEAGMKAHDGTLQ